MEKEYVKKGVKKERVDFIDYLDTLKTDEEENQESSMAVAKLQARPPYMCPTLRRQLEEKTKTSSSSKTYAFNITKTYQIFDIISMR